MKFRVTLKDPDGVYDCLRDAAVEWSNETQGLSPEETEQLVDGRFEQLKRGCEKWFKYDEYLEVEIDTDAGTCVVVPTS